MAKHDDVKKLKDAKAALEKVTAADKKAGRHYETDAYLEANAAVADAEKRVPWYRR